MATMEESFAQNLRTFRKNAGLTQKTLGAGIGYAIRDANQAADGTILSIEFGE